MTFEEACGQAEKAFPGEWDSAEVSGGKKLWVWSHRIPGLRSCTCGALPEVEWTEADGWSIWCRHGHAGGCGNLWLLWEALLYWNCYGPGDAVNRTEGVTAQQAAELSSWGQRKVSNTAWKAAMDNITETSGGGGHACFVYGLSEEQLGKLEKLGYELSMRTMRSAYVRWREG